MIGTYRSDELPALATDALVAGIDSPSLREVAGLRAANYQDARDKFIEGVQELGYALPSPPEARWALVRSWAATMVDGSMSPYEGSRKIWWEGWEELGRPDELTPFVGLASQWEDDEGHRAEYEARMIAAARRLLRTGA